MAQQHYLLGFVAGIVYSDGHEWLLNRYGNLCSIKPNPPAYDAAHTWKTLEQARKVAQRKKREVGDEYEVFVRPYCYTTSNPDTAKGLPLLSTAPPREVITVV